MACCGDLGFPVVTQPGQLKAALAAAGKDGPFRVVYQPRSGDVVEHWEYVGWLCLKAGRLIVVVDEIDMICSPGSSKNAKSEYWKKTNRMAALEQIVQYGRHHEIALVGIARAPQDVWRRLTGQSLRMLVFRMNERLELDALASRLGSHVNELPTLEEFQYLDWTDGGNVSKQGGRI
jgi:hypothetical protein